MKDMSENKCNKIKINDKRTIYEKTFIYDKTEHTSISVVDETTKKEELIGVACDNYRYSFNKNYIVFYTEDGDIDLVFDINSFEYINDEIKQFKAYQQVLDSGLELATSLDKEYKVTEALDKVLKRIIK